MCDSTRFSDMLPEEYAAMWGGDPDYMRAPNLPGDGYMFYNFAVEQGDPEFLRKFIPVIERTIQFCGQERYEPEEIADLEELLEHVKGLLVAKQGDLK